MYERDFVIPNVSEGTDSVYKVRKFIKFIKHISSKVYKVHKVYKGETLFVLYNRCANKYYFK